VSGEEKLCTGEEEGQQCRRTAVLGVVARGRRVAAAGCAGAERAVRGWLRRSAGAAQARRGNGRGAAAA